MSYRGRPLDDIKSVWRRTRKRAGLVPAFNPYSIRRALARQMRSRGVPTAEIAGWLGHRTEHLTTEVYAPFAPDYLMQGRAAINAWMKEIRALLAQRPGHEENLVRVSDVLGLVPRAAKPLRMVGATGIEPVTPTMST